MTAGCLNTKSQRSKNGPNSVCNGFPESVPICSLMIGRRIRPELNPWEAAVSPLHDPADILYQIRVYQIYNRELTNHCIQIITCFETKFWSESQWVRAPNKAASYQPRSRTCHCKVHHWTILLVITSDMDFFLIFPAFFTLLYPFCELSILFFHCILLVENR